MHVTPVLYTMIRWKFAAFNLSAGRSQSCTTQNEQATQHEEMLYQLRVSVWYASASRLEYAQFVKGTYNRIIFHYSYNILTCPIYIPSLQSWALWVQYTLTMSDNAADESRNQIHWKQEWSWRHPDSTDRNEDTRPARNNSTWLYRSSSTCSWSRPSNDPF